MSNVLQFPVREHASSEPKLPALGVYLYDGNVVAVFEKLDHTVAVVDHRGTLFETCHLPVGSTIPGPLSRMLLNAAEMFNASATIVLSRGLTPQARKAAIAAKCAAQLLCIELAEFILLEMRR